MFDRHAMSFTEWLLSVALPLVFQALQGDAEPARIMPPKPIQAPAKASPLVLNVRACPSESFPIGFTGYP